MTPEKQNQVIAVACGWDYYSSETHDPDGSFWFSKTPEFPDYFNDLNEIQKALWSLAVDPSFMSSFVNYLKMVVGIHSKSPTEECLLAPSSQWCEALVRTLNLWTDET
jgi:hypothetical protein